MPKVLLVDDDEDLLEMVALMLKANNMTVATLNTGKEVHNAIATTVPDIVIMDIYLGDSDGRELCKEIKEGADYTGFPVLLYSAADITSASIEKSLANAFYRKPFEMRTLVAGIHKHLK